MGTQDSINVFSMKLSTLLSQPTDQIDTSLYIDVRHIGSPRSKCLCSGLSQ